MFQFQTIYNGEWTWQDISFSPFYISEKIDGIFCAIVSGRPVSRQNKLIENPYVKKCLSTLPNGLVGELVTYDELEKREGFFIAGGKLRRKYQEEPLNFTYHVFDIWNLPTHTYEQRFNTLHGMKLMTLTPHVVLHPQYLVSSQEAATNMLKYWESLNPNSFEGAIIRNPRSFYKNGRTTIADQNCFKLISYHYDQGYYVGCTKNTEHDDRIGSIIIRWKDTNIKIGSGFDLELSRTLRKNPLIFKPTTILRFRYKKLTDTGVPREPTLVT